MLKYQCDYAISSGRCSNAAVVAIEKSFGYGQEFRYFCAEHQPCTWLQYDRVFHIKDDELVEDGISKQRREPVTIGEPVPREMIREAVRKHWEKKQDILIMRALGVKYE